MAQAFQDVQQLDSEENDHQLSRSEAPGARGHNHRREDAFWKDLDGRPRVWEKVLRLLVLLLVAICVIGFQRTLPPQPLPLQRLCSRLRLSLLVLGFNVLLLVAICVIGSQRTQLQVEFWKLKEDFSNFSSSTLMEIWTLSSHGGSAGDKVTSLESKLEKQQWDLKADHATLLFHLKHFPVDLRILACQMAFLRSNGTECCPVNWLEHDGSCYWFSHSGLTWPEAEKYCQLENAHLVVINSREEQKFIGQHMGHFRIWIGLTESDGSWKWVDGTDYRSSYKNWAATQPDNWQGHEEGGSEDCVEVQVDGRWNDNFCKQVQRWACEMRQNITS